MIQQQDQSPFVMRRVIEYSYLYLYGAWNMIFSLFLTSLSSCIL